MLGCYGARLNLEVKFNLPLNSQHLEVRFNLTLNSHHYAVNMAGD